MSIQSRLLYLTSTVFTAMVLVLASVSPARAGDTTHCCITRQGCVNSNLFNCEYGPECDDVDWYAECKGGEDQT
jgi:hypothetical protein